MIHLLAQTGISPEAVGIIIGSVVASLAGGGFIGKKLSDSKKVTIDGQPLAVKMAEEFVTRREFTEFKGEIRNDVTEMKGLFVQTMQKLDLQSEALMAKMDRQNERLTEKIAEGMDESRKGRVAIWNEHNPLAKKVERLEERADVARELGKLGEAILKTNAKPTRNS